MEIIPVIDLKGGQAVHARRGERDRYAPVRTSLCPSSDPLEVARGYLSLHPFARLYMADLDAIQGRGDNLEAVARIRRALPKLELWVDSGLAEEAGCRAWLARGLGKLVIGSEAQRDSRLLGRLRDTVAAGQVVLSLDFRAEGFLGPAAIYAEAEIWPRELIVISLARVGAGLGPDADRISAICARAGPRRVFAGGGVRDAGDLAALQRIGAAGALVATALHEGRLSRAEIERISARPPARPGEGQSER